MSLFLGFHLSRSHLAHHGELPEDRPDAYIDDGNPEVGFFTPSSRWLVALATGCTLCFPGLAVGLWICSLELLSSQPPWSAGSLRTSAASTNTG